MIGKLLDQVGPILIAVVVLGLIGTAIGVATSYSNKQKEGIESTLNAEEYRDYTDLDGRDDIKGSTVQTFLTAHSDDEACIEVKTLGTTTQYNYTSKECTTQVKDNSKIIKTACSKKTDKSYINPSALFSATVETNDNGVITLIRFEQQK